jgi:hypothetical protein
MQSSRIQDQDQKRDRERKRLATLSLASLGIVYGDIGTSPIYAIRECFHREWGVAPSPEKILGVLSLVFWTLLIVVSLKYLTFVLRADNRGEGGVIALTALISAVAKGRAVVLVGIGLFAGALLYGDGIITPAISVLSAVEGLGVVTSIFTPYFVPITALVLVVLFSVQHRGTAKIGALFGPITLVWFVTLGVLGLASIIDRPGVLLAVNPYHAIRFLVQNTHRGFMAALITTPLLLSFKERFGGPCGNVPRAANRHTRNLATTTTRNTVFFEKPTHRERHGVSWNISGCFSRALPMAAPMMLMMLGSGMMSLSGSRALRGEVLARSGFSG